MVGNSFFYNLDNAIDILVPKNGVVVQVGANNGVEMDEINVHVKAKEMNGLLIEPIPHLAEQLRENYSDQPQLKIAQVAITEENGPATMLYRDPENQPENFHHFHQLGQLKQSQTVSETSLAALKDDPEQYVSEIEVEGKTLQTAFNENNITKIDLLQIDVEGYDWHIIKQIDFEKYKPEVINFEFVHLPEEDRIDTIQYLCDNGYAPFTLNGLDILAVQKERLPELVGDQDLSRYQHYIDKGFIKNDDGKGYENLVYAVALLHQAADCSSSSIATDVMQFKDNIRSTGARREPNWAMVADAMERMEDLFVDTKSCVQFFNKEMPRLEIISPELKPSLLIAR
jgi:FkbM family methyltransferase